MTTSSTEGHPIEQNTLPAGWALKHLGRERLHELRLLVRAHGCDPNMVAWVAYDLLDAPLLRLGLYCRDEKGNIAAETVEGKVQPVVNEVEVALRGELPGWWQPGLDAS